MSQQFKFNRMEVAGALGDLGTLLPIALAMILVNGLNPIGIFFSVAVFYIFSGLYFGVPVPVQPMKIIGAYAVATAMSSSQIFASSILMATLLLLIGLTGAINKIQKITPQAVICGVQLSTGLLLALSGVQFILGTSPFQQQHFSAEPFLGIQMLGPIPIGLVLGIIGAVITVLLIHNRKFPAGLVLVVGGCIVGLILGARPGIGIDSLSFHFPEILPSYFPEQVDYSFALFALVLPQLPMTLGNAVIAYTDLSKKYFAAQAQKVTNRNVCLSMAGANLFSFLIGGMPLCHGAGGLAAHYHFGARSAGSNLIIGFTLLLLTLLLGEKIVELFKLLPMAILGILLIFTGVQLSQTVRDLKQSQDFIVVGVILVFSLVSNLAVGFVVGFLIANLIRWKKNLLSFLR